MPPLGTQMGHWLDTLDLSKTRSGLRQTLQKTMGVTSLDANTYGAFELFDTAPQHTMQRPDPNSKQVQQLLMRRAFRVEVDRRRELWATEWASFSTVRRPCLLAPLICTRLAQSSPHPANACSGIHQTGARHHIDVLDTHQM